MATFSINLRRDKKNTKGFCPIIIYYSHNSQRALLSTAISAPESSFQDKEGEWLKPDTPNASGNNTLISDALNKARKIVTDFKHTKDRYPESTEIRDLFNLKTGKTKDISASFFDMFDAFMYYQTHERGKPVVYGTYKNYKKVKVRLEEYEKFTRKKFDFTSIDRTFADKFERYQITEHDSGPNTLGSYIRIIKAFMHWCENRHDMIFSKAIMSSLKSTDEETWQAYLELEEIDKIMGLSFPNNPLYDQSRDTFVLLCCLGCRHGDLTRTLTANIVTQNGRRLFRKLTKKNNKLTQVYLNARAEKILDKYEGMDPQKWVSSNQQCNKDIKKICRLAGIVEKIQVTKGAGENRRELIEEKCDHIKTHTGRRSFINIMLNLGVDERDIAAMTGQSLKILQRYKQSNTQRLQAAIDKWDEPRPEPKKPKADKSPKQSLRVA